MLETDYVDLSSVKSPEAPKFVPNNSSVVKNSCLKSPKGDENGTQSQSSPSKSVRFGDTTTHYIEKFDEEYSE